VGLKLYVGGGGCVRVGSPEGMSLKVFLKLRRTDVQDGWYVNRKYFLVSHS